MVRYVCKAASIRSPVAGLFTVVSVTCDVYTPTSPGYRNNQPRYPFIPNLAAHFINQVRAEGRILDKSASITSLAIAAYSPGTPASSPVYASSQPLIKPRFAKPPTTSSNRAAMAVSISPCVQRSHTNILTGKEINVPIPGATSRHQSLADCLYCASSVRRLTCRYGLYEASEWRRNEESRSAR